MRKAAFGEVRNQWQKLIVLAFIALGITACESVGPLALENGRNEYNDAINTTDTQELLLNIVRLRFNDKPYVLQISSISAKTELELGVSGYYDQGRTEREKNRRGRRWETRHGGRISGRLDYAEKPNIIYQPLRGEKFVRQLLSPLDLETLFLLRFSGWEINSILRVFARAINNVPNAPTGGDSTPTGIPEYEAFLEGIEALDKIEAQGGLVVAYSGRKRKAGEAVALRFLPAVRQSEAFKTLTRVFKLDPRAQNYQLKIGWAPETRRDIVIETRPILSAMFYVGRGIEIPEKLFKAGVVHVNMDENNEPFDWGKVLGDLFLIRSSYRKPLKSFSAVKYRDYWYYIDERDVRSKETLTMLHIVLTLRAGGSPSTPPVITLPVN